MFSDNIVFAIEVPENDLQRSLNFESLLIIASYFQSYAFLNGSDWLLRGGITVGKIYIDDIMVWGEGLLSAYDLENCDKFKNMPRIVIDSNVRDYLQPIVDAYDARVEIAKNFPQGELRRFLETPPTFRQDDLDGECFVDYEITPVHKDPKSFLMDFLLSIRRLQSEAEKIGDGYPKGSVEQKESVKRKESIKRKHEWIIHYHNTICDKYDLTECRITP